jgi:hypothetical protein
MDPKNLNEFSLSPANRSIKHKLDCKTWFYVAIESDKKFQEEVGNLISF